MCSPDAPDTSGVNAAALANAEVAKEALDWFKQEYSNTADARKEASNVALDQSRAQTALAKSQTAIANDTQARVKSTLEPLQNQILKTAQEYDTPDRREAEAADVMGKVGTSFDTTRADLGRTLASRGVDAGSGNATASLAQTAVAEAAAKAAAGNTARKNVEAIGAAKMGDAASMLQGLPQTQLAQVQSGINAGNSAVSNAGVPVQIANQGAALMQQGFGTAIQGNQSAGNLYGTAANIQNQANQSDSAVWGALGQTLGSAAGAGKLFGISDKNKKKNRKPQSGAKSLAMVRKMPVERWKYKKGVADDGEHVGPMAQDVQAASGNSVAPGGKVVDLVSMNGIALSAIQNLDKRLSKVEKRATLAARR